MKFSEDERNKLLEVPFVGEKVISRFEEVGYDNFEKLASVSPEALLEFLSGHLNSSCYKNSPQAKKSITGAIECAQNNTV